MIKLSNDEIGAILRTVPNDPIKECKFFEDIRFFPGRWRDPKTNKVIQPQELLRIYEEILSQIQRVDSQRYATMHKGTPFYIMGWLAYEMRDYEKGVFYMDAALSEDVSNFPHEWMTFPAASFIFLDDSNKEAAASEITIQTKLEVDIQLKRFSKEAGVTLDMDTFINKFVKPQAANSPYRSIITSLLTFLLESKDISLNLELRSSRGGTLEPFLTYFFKGGLIFESLLKRKYGSSDIIALRGYLQAGKGALELKAEIYKKIRPYKLEQLPILLQNWETEDFQEKAIAIAYAVRNTAGHDLAWQDIFTDKVFLKLYEGIVNAVFWTIKKVYNI